MSPGHNCIDASAGKHRLKVIQNSEIALTVGFNSQQLAALKSQCKR